MTPEELKQYKKDYNSNLSEYKHAFTRNMVTIITMQEKQTNIMMQLYEAIDEHEKVCNEFDREKG